MSAPSTRVQASIITACTFVLLVVIYASGSSRLSDYREEIPVIVGRVPQVNRNNGSLLQPAAAQRERRNTQDVTTPPATARHHRRETTTMLRRTPPSVANGASSHGTASSSGSDAGQPIRHPENHAGKISDSNCSIETLDECVEAYLSLVSPMTLGASGSFVILTSGTYAYRAVVINFLARMLQLGRLDAVLVLCFDNDLASFLRERGIDCLPLETTALQSAVIDGATVEQSARANDREIRRHAHDHIWRARFSVVVRLLRKGYGVLLSDADAFWKGDPTAELATAMAPPTSADIVASRGSWPKKLFTTWGATACMGFIAMRPTASVMALTELAQVLLDAHDGGDDQIAINAALEMLHFGRPAYTTWQTPREFVHGRKESMQWMVYVRSTGPATAHLALPIEEVTATIVRAKQNAEAAKSHRSHAATETPQHGSSTASVSMNRGTPSSISRASLKSSVRFLEFVHSEHTEDGNGSQPQSLTLTFLGHDQAARACQHVPSNALPGVLVMHCLNDKTATSKYESMQTHGLWLINNVTSIDDIHSFHSPTIDNSNLCPATATKPCRSQFAAWLVRLLGQ